MPDASDTFAGFRATRHFASLDGLRCLSIIPVVWHHSNPVLPAGVLGKGTFGVDLFFAISGFLITTLLLREKSSRGQVSLRAFYMRRSLRIFPVYYAVLGLFCLHAWLIAPDGPQRDHFFQSLIYHATYTTNWLVDFSVAHPVTFAFAWSLACEEQFYLTWPWAIRLTKKAWIPALIVGGALLVDQAAERVWLSALLPPGSLRLHIVYSLATPICLGCLAALALHHRNWFLVVERILGWRLSAPAVLLLLGYVVSRNDLSNFTVHVVLALLVVACCIRPDHGLAWLLNQPALAHVGKVSYGIYLLHVMVIGMWRRVVPQPDERVLWVFGLALLGSVAVATLSHRYFEAPFLRLKDRFRPRTKASTDPPPMTHSPAGSALVPAGQHSNS